MRISYLFIIFLAAIMFSTSSFAMTQVRATDLTSEQVTKILSSRDKTYVIEFRKGDQIPISFEAEGDLFDSKDNVNNVLNIRKNFFLKLEDQDPTISFDGENYESLKDAITGSFSANSDLDASQIPALIKIMLSVYLR